ncbi:hypothetical protein EYF80_001319 [Liparis tanakae]|uniref:Uncharacterized protein n=1 Tax=Liparis tanakae TaxID=230148 RepID=A0A4Z2JE66_9TELE|nr:hypothetical protein EYF80_001319 [Liparis tanakae]
MKDTAFISGNYFSCLLHVPSSLPSAGHVFWGTGGVAALVPSSVRFSGRGEGVQSGWWKWMSNVRAQLANTRFSVMKRWWLPRRPRS